MALSASACDGGGTAALGGASGDGPVGGRESAPQSTGGAAVIGHAGTTSGVGGGAEQVGGGSSGLGGTAGGAGSAGDAPTPATAGGAGSGGSGAGSAGADATAGTASGGSSGGGSSGGNSSGGNASGGNASGGNSGAGERYVVAVVQSQKSRAADLTYDDVKDLVDSAIVQSGGLDFIHDGQTVVLKPNLVTAYSDSAKATPSDPTVNGITTDFRVVKAVAEAVRLQNPRGKILVMEGSSLPTRKVYSMLGYTSENFGTLVDEFIALEGASCTDVSTVALEQRVGMSGKKYWINSRYVNADVVISLPTMKTHYDAGITGAVKNLGLGTTPVGQFPSGSNSADSCSRGQTASMIDHSGPEPLGAFIRDYYSLRPADFVVMDALQGLEHGPLPAWDGSGSYDYVASQKNMRLILAGKNAVALDTIAALIMKCDPRKVPHLTKLEADGLGSTDVARISVMGKQVSEVAKAFAGAQTAICPGR